MRTGTGKKPAGIVLLFMLWTFVSLGFFGIKTYAAGVDSIIGPDIPVTETIYLEDNAEREEDIFLSPYTLNILLDTGEHYSYLSSDEKALYAAMYKAVAGQKYVPYGTELFFDPNTYTSDYYVMKYLYVFNKGSTDIIGSYEKADLKNAINRAYEALYFDHPDQIEYYMVYPLRAGCYNLNGEYYNWIIMKSYYDESMFASMDSAIKSSLGTWVSQIKAAGLAGSGFEAVNELDTYDYYSGLVKYDYSCLSGSTYSMHFNVAHTAYGSLVNKNAVCDGYSAGYKMIMEELGVDTLIVTGDGGNIGNEGGHAWNIVRLDGSWYEVDTTWYGETKYHDFFNRTTSEFEAGLRNAVHKRTQGTGYFGFRLPTATGTHYTYEYITGNRYSMTRDAVYSAQNISMTPSAATLYPDESFVPTVSFTPANTSNQNYTLTSSDPSVAFVSGKAVTGLKPGKATITAVSADGSFKSSCTVYVNITEPGNYVTAAGDTYYISNKGTAQLVSLKSKSGKLTIPATVKFGTVSYKVTTIADNALKNKNFTSVTGGANLTSIGKNAFSGCKKLTKVKLTSKVLAKIGTKAFFNCSKLKSVELNGTKLSSIGSKAFKGLKKKCTISIKSSAAKFKKLQKLIKKSGTGTVVYKKMK